MRGKCQAALSTTETFALDIETDKKSPSRPPLVCQNKGLASTSPGATNTSRVTRDDNRVRDDNGDADTECIKQLDIWQASLPQLLHEIAEIMKCLDLLETRSNELTQSQTSAVRQNPQHRLTDSQFRFLIDLHLAYQRQHHDIYMATQHPLADGDIKDLAKQKELPARFWRYGVYNFLELLRLMLPESYEHMLVFINQTYQMITLFLETVPAFKVIWMECLGDVGRYRVSLEAENILDRTHWASVSASWFLRVSDHQPMVGRLDHHVAVCSRPQPVRQLHYYVRSLSVDQPFKPAGESMMNLLNPIMAEDPAHPLSKLPPLQASFIRTHAILFSGKYPEKLETSIAAFIEGLDQDISEKKSDWLPFAYQIAVVNCCALLGYGSQANILGRVMQQPRLVNLGEKLHQDQSTIKTIAVFTRTIDVVLRRTSDPNILPFLHVTMAMIRYAMRSPAAQRILLSRCPWPRIVTALNAFKPEPASLEELKMAEQLAKAPFDGQPKTRPLPEDLAMRGLPFAYMPLDCVTGDSVIDDERDLEVPSLSEQRRKRIFWLGYRIARREVGSIFDDESGQFKVAHSTKL